VEVDWRLTKHIEEYQLAALLLLYKDSQFWPFSGCLLGLPDGLQFRRRRDEAQLGALLYQPSNPPIVVVLFLDMQKILGLKRDGATVDGRIVVNCAIKVNIGLHGEKDRIVLQKGSVNLGQDVYNLIN
jgi:hypothetical protein